MKNAQPHWVRSFGAAIVLAAGTTLLGCAHEEAPPAAEPTSTLTVTSTPPIRTPRLKVSGEIISACKIDLTAVHQPVASRAPHFDFDTSDLMPEDYTLLDKVAECLKTGPLEGRSVALIGRADPRGETEYNFVLGAHRSGSVAQYLESRGVAEHQLQATSRGKLDATGTDESTWAQDRRVDISLL